MKLEKIIKNIDMIEVLGNKDIEIFDICYDSRKITKNCLFVCLKGANFDGHNFIDDAIKKGAVAIAVQENICITDATVVKTSDTRKLLAQLSVNFFEHPADKLTTIAITGTKGKTTTSFMIKSILEDAGYKCGIIGTLGVIIGNSLVKSENTTPESYEIQKQLNNIVKNDCKYAIMEASSIGLKTHRLDGLDFDYGVFTNLSSDHIGKNEHKDMDEYIECKSLLFKKCKVGCINIDDATYTSIIKDCICQIKTFGLNTDAEYNASDIKLINDDGNIGVSFDLHEVSYDEKIYISIPGKFNVYNALAAISVCDQIGILKENIKSGLKKVKVKGRVEPINISKDYALFIDYAHNALSMKNILSTLREYKPKRLITIFGAGGDRPKVRRYEMGEVSGNMADLSVITSDNPRTEDPINIIEDIKTGINKTPGKYIVIPDRKEAIKYCIYNAQKGDVIVLAGKGHEDYQEINGVKYPFDERQVISEIISQNKTI